MGLRRVDVGLGFRVYIGSIYIYKGLGFMKGLYVAYIGFTSALPIVHISVVCGLGLILGMGTRDPLRANVGFVVVYEVI